MKILDWNHYLDTTVRVYRNLNNGKMSIQSKQAGGWRVVGHVTDCVITQVAFTVRESGRKRVLQQQVKNVHAWAEGTLLAEADGALDVPISLKYDPYHNVTFVDRLSGLPISKCRILIVRENQVFVSQDALENPVNSRQPTASTIQFPLFWNYSKTILLSA